MRTIESSPVEDLDIQPEGSRFFVIHIMDPEMQATIKTSISLNPKMQESISMAADLIGMADESTIPWAAAGMVLQHLYGDDAVLKGLDRVSEIREVSREELREYIVERDARIAESAD